MNLWDPDEQASAFLGDLEAKPAALERLARSLSAADGLATIPVRPRRLVLLGMGSSHYAAQVAALRLRAAGLDAVAELGSATIGTPAGADTLVVAISATGRSAETLAALDRHVGRSRLVAVTNDPESPIAAMADAVLPLVAGPELGGVACRAFQHTLLVLLALEAHVTGTTFDIPGLCRRTALATGDLLDRRATWLPAVMDAVAGPDGVYALAPAERWSSAAQSALMFREGPRRPATGCETGDWSHVDVYLTRTLDYRALLYAGSRWDAQALEWLTSRRSTVVAVGTDVAGARTVVRYRGDDDPLVALTTETLVAELAAAGMWARDAAVSSVR